MRTPSPRPAARGRSPSARRTSTRREQRGLTLVELMVGLTVGAIVVAGALGMVATQLHDHRRVLLEAQLAQDLRAAADIVTRELRRSGHWTQAERGVASNAGGGEANPYAAVTPTDAAAQAVSFSYMRREGDEGPYGFKLDGGVVRTLLAGGGWQDLTDGSSLRVTALQITPRHAAPVVLPCPSECPGGGTACWPTLQVREFAVEIRGQAVADAAVQRTLHTTVRLRNDELSGHDAGTPGRVCPA